MNTERELQQWLDALAEAFPNGAIECGYQDSFVIRNGAEKWPWIFVEAPHDGLWVGYLFYETGGEIAARSDSAVGLRRKLNRLAEVTEMVCDGGEWLYLDDEEIADAVRLTSAEEVDQCTS